MKHFLFCVVKSAYYGFDALANYEMSQYTVSIDDNEELDFGAWATRFVLAERMLTGNYLFFHYVIALEHRNSAAFDGDTRAHLMVPDSMADANYQNDSAGVVGYRGYPGAFDSYVALQVGQNREVGRVTKKAMGGAVARTDLIITEDAWHNDNRLSLRTDTDLADYWFPAYSDLLSRLPQVEPLGSVTRAGNFVPHAPPVGNLLMCNASDYRAIRRVQSRKANTRRDFELLIDSTILELGRNMLEYERAMNEWNETWGDAHVPAILGAMSFFWEASRIWFDIGVSLGFMQPEAPLYRTGYDTPAQGEALYPDTFNNIRLGANQEAVISIVQRLADNYAQGEAAAFFYKYQAMYSGFSTFEERHDAAIAIYDNWEALTEWMQTIFNCLLTLRVILQVKEGFRRLGEPHLKTPVKATFYGVSVIPASTTHLTLTPFREMKFVGPGEILAKEDHTNIVIVKLPERYPHSEEVPRPPQRPIAVPFVLPWWVDIAIAILIGLAVIASIPEFATPVEIALIPAERIVLREIFTRVLQSQIVNGIEQLVLKDILLAVIRQWPHFLKVPLEDVIYWVDTFLSTPTGWTIKTLWQYWVDNLYVPL
jgi:hypothetical protein